MGNTLSDVLESLATRITWKDEEEAKAVFENIEKVREHGPSHEEKEEEEGENKESAKKESDNKTPDDVKTPVKAGTK